MRRVPPRKRALGATTLVSSTDLRTRENVALTKSIEEFINQDELIELMKQNNFQNCNYRNLSGGIVAIHSGWKI